MPFINTGVSGKAWINEHFQRDSVLAGLQQANDNDVVIISDVDEIPNIKNKQDFIDSVTQNKVLEVAMNHFHFFFDNALCRSRNLDGKCTKLALWGHSKAVTFSYIKEANLYTPEDIRQNTLVKDSTADGVCWKDLGWHFSYVIPKDDILDKFLSFSHTEVATHMAETGMLSGSDKIIEKVCNGGQGLWPALGLFNTDVNKYGYKTLDINDERVYSTELSDILNHKDLDDYMIASSCKPQLQLQEII